LNWMKLLHLQVLTTVTVICQHQQLWLLFRGWLHSQIF
jgi:hypothetical protein